MNDRKFTGLCLAAIVLLGAVLRFYNFSGFSLSNDELSALNRLQFNNLHDLFEKGIKPDFHPAGVQLFLFYWTQLFGFSEFAVRLPFVVAGILSIAVIYLLGKQWFNEYTGLLSSAALASLQFPILYSQIARPYSLGLLFTLCTGYFFTILLDKYKKGQKPGWLIYTGLILSVSACMYIHYFAMITAGIIILIGFLLIPARSRLYYLLCGIPVLLLYLPNVPVFLFQMKTGGLGGADGWLGRPGSDFFFKYIQYAFNDSQLIQLLFACILIGSSFFFRKKNTLSLFHLITILIFLIPFFTGYYYSILKNPVLQFSILLFSFPFLLLFIFSFITKDVSKKIFICILLFITISSVASTVLEKKYYSTQHFGVFKEIAEDIIATDNQYTGIQVGKAVNVSDPFYINYYLDKYHHPSKAGIYTIKDQADFSRLNDLVQNCETPYFLYVFSNINNAPEIEQIIRIKFQEEIARKDYFNSGFRLFKKGQGALSKPGYEFYHDFETNKLKNDSAQKTSELSYEGKYCSFVDDQYEYSATFQSALGNIGYISSGLLLVKAMAKCNQENSRLKLVISIDENNNNIFWKGVELNDYFENVNRWKKVFAAVELPVNLNKTDMINIYFWNEGKEKAYFDNLKIQFIPAEK